MKASIFSLVYLFSLHCSFAHDGVINGRVLDKKSNAPLAGANVVLLGTVKGEITDRFGSYSFLDLQAGQYHILISYLGYLSDTLAVNVTSHEVTEVTTYLSETTFELAAITVSQQEEDNVQTINRIDMEMRPTKTSQDILRLIPGLVIAQHAGGGKAEQIFLRGFDIDHGTDIALSVDGIPVNMVSHAHGQGYADLHFLIPETVRSVDFNKGPYYARHGDFNTAGYANFKTLDRPDNSLLKFEAGDFDTYRTIALIDLGPQNSEHSTHHAYFAAEYFYTNGYFESPQHFNRFNVFGKYNAILNNNTSLSMSLSTFRSKWDASGQIPDRAVRQGLISRFGAIDDTEGGNTGRTNINLIIEKSLPNNATFTNQFYWTRYDFTLYSNFTFFLNDSENGDQIRQTESRNLYGYNGSYNFHHHLGSTTLTTTIGGGLRFDAVEDSELSRTANRQFTLERVSSGDINQLNASAYLSETIALSPSFTVNAALRFDQFLFEYDDHLDAVYRVDQVTKNIFTPKLNFYYNANPQLQIFLKTGGGFHSNDARVVVATTGKEILPRAWGTDVGVHYKPLPSLLMTVAAWGLDLEQEFVYVGDEGVVEPSGKTRRYGVDVSVRYQIMPWLLADADFNWTAPRFREEPDNLNYVPLAPTLTSIGGLTARTKSGLNASLRYRYIGDRPANEDNSVTAEGYFLMDAVVRWERTKYEINLSIENIFDVEWNEAQFDATSRLAVEAEPVSELHYTPGNPTWVRISVGYKF